MPADELHHGVESLARQRCEGVRATNNPPPLFHVQFGRMCGFFSAVLYRCAIYIRTVQRRQGGRLHRCCHRLLGQHIQRIGHHVQRLQVSFEQPIHNHRGGLCILLVQRIDGRRAGSADGMPSAATALNRRRHGRWRAHLDHVIHQTHVDAQLQRAGGHHALEVPCLERLFNVCAFVLGNRPVVRASDDGFHPADSRGLRHELSRITPGGGGQRVWVILLGPLLIQRAREAFGAAARVDEHQRGAVVHHLLVDRALHVRPHTLLLRQGGFFVHAAGHAGAGSHLGVSTQPLAHQRRAHQRLIDERLFLGFPELLVCVFVARCSNVFIYGWILEILHHGANVHVPGLRDLRIHHRYRSVTAEEAGHGIDRINRRGEPNALHRRARDHLQPFQAERQVRSPLGSRHGVHFVHDDGLHSTKSPRCLGREHEVERFRRGNQNLRWVAKHLGPLVGWGITAAYTHPYRRHRLPHCRGSAGDACQRCGQVSVDVNPQCLQRRNVQHTRSGLRCVREQGLFSEFRQ